MRWHLTRIFRGRYSNSWGFLRQNNTTEEKKSYEKVTTPEDIFLFVQEVRNNKQTLGAITASVESNIYLVCVYKDFYIAYCTFKKL